MAVRRDENSCITFGVTDDIGALVHLMVTVIVLPR